MSSLNYQKQLSVRHQTDVLVVGGGPGGCAAAWSAAKTGARVLLLEGQSCLGGLGTAGMVPAFMEFSDGVHFYANGFGRLLLDRLSALGEAIGQPQLAEEIKVDTLKRVYEDLLTEAGVEFVFHTQLIDVLTSNGHIDAAVFAAKSGMFAVTAGMYIDGTGDGDLCVWAGAPYQKGDENGQMMAGTLCQLWAGIDWSHWTCNDDTHIRKAITDGVFTTPDPHLPGIWKISEQGIGGGNVGHAFGVDGTDERSLTRALVHSRKLVDEYRRYYQEYLTGYENMELVTTAPMMGIRETRRIEGEETLTVDAFHARAVFDNEIGRYCYNIDTHAAKPTAEAFEKFHHDHTTLRYKPGESYGLPYGILVPRGVDNLFVTGRCVSTDRPMQSSVRVMPGCYITGQAAGAAAQLALETNRAPKDVDVRTLQSRLKGLGAYLPNA